MYASKKIVKIEVRRWFTQALVMLVGCSLTSLTLADSEFGHTTPVNTVVSDQSLASDNTGNQPEPSLFADDESVDPDQDLDALDSALDLMFEDFDVVITAGRSSQRVNQAGAAVSIFTAKDIHYSGVTNIAEALEFIPGMNVTRMDRNRYAIGVRGMGGEINDRTLFLLDGQQIGGAVAGGADFQRFSILPEDIERIEVVRGPGGAVWGANAFNGVVNVIRKDPREQLGFLSSSTINEFGDYSGYFRYGAGDEKFGWRISAQYDSIETSEDAIDNDTITSRDFGRNTRIDWQAGYSVDSDTEITFGVSFADIERGDFELIGFQSGLDEEIQTTRFNFKFDRQIDGGSSFMIQAYGLYEDVTRPSVWRQNSADMNVDALYSFAPSENHSVLLGASLRFSFFDFDRQDFTNSVRELSDEEQWAGFYFVDRWQVSDRNSLETQARVDWYSGTQTDWSGRMSWIHWLDDQGDHTLRFSVAKAFRAQQVSIRELGIFRSPLLSPPFLPGTYGFALYPAGELDNEQIYSGEIGYYGRFSEEITIRVNGFFNLYEDLVGVITIGDPTGQGMIANTLANAYDAESYGFETEITHTTDALTLSAWYAFNHFDFTQRLDPDVHIRAYRPTENDTGVRARLVLNEDHTLSMNYRYTGEGQPDGLDDGGWPERHRLDLTWAMDVFDGRGEIMIGVSDLLDETDIVVNPVGTLFLNSFETPGRSIFARVQIKF